MKMCAVIRFLILYFEYLLLILYFLYQVTFPPYFFECLLADSVVDASGSALIGNGVVFFKLEKKVHGLWGHLQSPYSGEAVFTLFLCIAIQVVVEIAVFF